jgi:hypothetical protein
MPKHYMLYVVETTKYAFASIMAKYAYALD